MNKPSNISAANLQPRRRADILVRSKVRQFAGYSTLQSRRTFGSCSGQECPRAWKVEACLAGRRCSLHESSVPGRAGCASEAHSPSPQPSPQGRGRSFACRSASPRHLDSSRTGLRGSLSPRERVGVRGKATGAIAWATPVFGDACKVRRGRMHSEGGTP